MKPNFVHTLRCTLSKDCVRHMCVCTHTHTRVCTHTRTFRRRPAAGSASRLSPILSVLFCGLFNLSKNIKTLFFKKEILNLPNKFRRLVQTLFKGSHFVWVSFCSRLIIFDIDKQILRWGPQHSWTFRAHIHRTASLRLVLIRDSWLWDRICLEILFAVSLLLKFGKSCIYLVLQSHSSASAVEALLCGGEHGGITAEWRRDTYHQGERIRDRQDKPRAAVPGI